MVMNPLPKTFPRCIQLPPNLRSPCLVLNYVSNDEGRDRTGVSLSSHPHEL